MIVTSADLLRAAKNGLVRPGLAMVERGRRLADRPDITLRPDADIDGQVMVFARRQLAAPGPWTALTWYPLFGFRRSRLSLDDQRISYGNGL